MARWSAELARLLSTHAGVVTSAELFASGLTPSQVRRLVTDRLLVRIHDGVYRCATHPDTLEARCIAACRADAELVLTGPTGGKLWGLRRVRAHPLVTAMRPVGRASTLGGVLVKRTSVLTAEDIVHRPNGIRLASPPRTWFDLADWVDDGSFVSITEQVLERHCELATLWRTRRRLAARGRNGLARVNRVLSTRAAWQRPAQSDLELQVLLALQRRGIELVRQQSLLLRNGIRIHFDGADPAIRWALEVDHVTWHGGRFEDARDTGRDRQARLCGWQVERVTDAALALDFDGEIDILAELHRHRRETLARRLA